MLRKTDAGNRCDWLLFADEDDWGELNELILKVDSYRRVLDDPPTAN